MKQMPLFSAEQEATRTLREDYDLLAYNYRYVEARLEKAKEEFKKLREERDALKRDLAQMQCDRARLMAERDAALAKAERYWLLVESLDAHAKMLEGLIYRAGGADRRPGPPLEPLLKKLVTVCHPDKWAAGQLATALAHELMVVLNDVRIQLKRPQV